MIYVKLTKKAFIKLFVFMVRMEHNLQTCSKCSQFIGIVEGAKIDRRLLENLGATIVVEMEDHGKDRAVYDPNLMIL